MESQVCPYLGVLDAQNRWGPHVEYPSFENQCLAAGDAQFIMLGDQATYCLSGGCGNCPRFQATRGQGTTTPGLPGYVPFYPSAEEAWRGQASTIAAAGVAPNMMDLTAGEDGANTDGRRRWAWVGAGVIFLVVFLCGSMIATYTGWEWVARNYPDGLAAGRVNTLSDASTPVVPAVYVVMTATPVVLPGDEPPTAQVVAIDPGAAAPGSVNPAEGLALPAAVTPTPITVNPLAPVADAALAPLAPPAAGEANGATPLVNVELPVPTRRPTPEFDVPTSTPLPDLPTNTPSPTPTPLGTPIVIFGPDQKELLEGECTLVRWNVQNVREVYYENLPMNGKGEREECIGSRNETYSLMVVLPNGQPQIYTTTVTFLPPTPTPTVTPSFTPEPITTPTWTPQPPTATPTPDVFYATNLTTGGSPNVSCGPGQTCEVGLLVSNGGSGVDNLTVVLVQAGPFPVQICRPDGVCGSDSLALSSVGPGNTAYVTARFTIPGDASPQGGSFGFQSFSEGSGRTASSGVMAIQVNVP